MRFFKLTKTESRIVPNTGECLGLELKSLAQRMEERGHAHTTNIPKMLDLRHAAAVYHLAADSYQHAASVSLGHRRTKRYEVEANRLRRKADELTSEANAVTD